MKGDMIKKSFLKVYRHFGRSDIQKAIEFYALFGGYEKFVAFEKDISYNIMHILQNYHTIEQKLHNRYDLLLSAFATGDRKVENTIKKSSVKESIGYQHFKDLVASHILIQEISREKPPKKTHPKQKLKKELRHYKIQHKARFAIPFMRFWYRYIYPSKELIEKKRFDVVVEFILQDLDNYVSLTFEELCNELLQEKFPNTKSVGSYWDRKVELDILFELENERLIVGECKWKNSKICKKTLTSLQKKAAIAGFTPSLYALFSKSSFSNELLKNKNKNILLFDLEDFKEWSEEKVYKKKEKKPYSFEF